MEKIEKLRKIFNREKIDGYIIPKNDEFFGEYIPDHNDRLNFISGFSGSFGFALILKGKIIYSSMEDTPYKLITKAEINSKFLQFQIKCQVTFLKEKNCQLVSIQNYLLKILYPFFLEKINLNINR